MTSTSFVFTELANTMKYRGGFLYSLVLTEWRHCVSQNEVWGRGCRRVSQNNQWEREKYGCAKIRERELARINRESPIKMRTRVCEIARTSKRIHRENMNKTSVRVCENVRTWTKRESEKLIDHGLNVETLPLGIFVDHIYHVPQYFQVVCRFSMHGQGHQRSSKYGTLYP